MACEELALIVACREGSLEACSQLLSQYEGYIYSLCYRFSHQREEALEMAQEAMFRLIQALPSFQPNRRFKPWLRRVVINSCLNLIRHKEPATIPLENAERWPAATAADPAAQAEALEIQHSLHKALQDLPVITRLVIVLRHQEGLSYQEIADETGLPIGTVRTHLHRGRQRLRAALSEHYAWEASL